MLVALALVIHDPRCRFWASDTFPMNRFRKLVNSIHQMKKEKMAIPPGLGVLLECFAMNCTHVKQDLLAYLTANANL